MEKNKINILFVIDSLNIGGAGILTLEIIGNLDKNYFNVGLLSLTPNNTDGYDLSADIPQGINTIYIDIWGLSFLKRIFFIKKIAKEYDIVHSCLEEANFYCSLVNLLLLRKKKFVCTSHGEDGVFIDDKLLKEELKKKKFFSYKIRIKYLLTFLFRFYDKFIAVCYFVEGYLIKKRHINPNKISVIYHGINFNKLSINVSDAEIMNLKKELEILQNDFIIAYCGRLSFGKGLFSLIEVMSDLIDEYPNFKLLLLGDGELKNDLQKLIDNKSISHNIRILGYRKNVNLYYEIIDVLVHPSLSESTSLVTQEAMYMGKVVLCSDVGGIPEIVEDGKNGFLFKKNDKDMLKNKLRKIYLDRNSMDEVRMRARNTIIEKFDISKNVNLIAGVFKKLI